MIRRLFQGLMGLVLLSGVGLFADGFKFKNGRLDQEKVIELKLTPAQAKAVASNFKPGMIIHLTKAQQAEIRAKSGVKEGPTQLELWRASDLQGDCSDFLWNIGLLFKPGWLELPVATIVSDQEARDRQPDPNG